MDKASMRGGDLPTPVTELIAASVALIKREQDAGGAFPACPTYATYQYCWFRDGAFIADAMSRVGEVDSAEAFFAWCTRVLVDRTDRIRRISATAARQEVVASDELLPTRYELDGSDSPVPWSQFQVDGYGTWLRTVVDHCDRWDRPVAPFADAVALTVDYLGAVGTLPCFDWWEEFPQERHTATLAAVASGLQAASSSGCLTPDQQHVAETTRQEATSLIMQAVAQDGHLTKWAGNDKVDGSLLACFVPFGVIPLNDPIAVQTLSAVKRDLVREGVYRYVGDTFYGGGEWINLTAWLGWCEARMGDLAGARSRLEWIALQAEGGLLPEQVITRAQKPEFIGQWETSWGPVATPLLWSHAMLLTLAGEVSTSSTS